MSASTRPGDDYSSDHEQLISKFKHKVGKTTRPFRYLNKIPYDYTVLSRGHRTRNVQLSFQCQRRGMAKNGQTSAQLHSFHMLARLCSKSSKLRFNSMNQELPDIQAGFRKGRGTRDQIANICWIMEKAREFQKNIYFCFIDYAKAFDCVDHNQL